MHCGHLQLAGSTIVFVYVANYLPCLLNFMPTIMPEIKLKIPNITKPPATPPTIAAILASDRLSNCKGTRGVCGKIKIVISATHQIFTINININNTLHT